MNKFDESWNHFVEWNCPELEGSQQLNDMRVMFYLGASTFNHILHHYIDTKGPDAAFYVNEIVDQVNQYLAENGAYAGPVDEILNNLSKH